MCEIKAEKRKKKEKKKKTFHCCCGVSIKVNKMCFK